MSLSSSLLLPFPSSPHSCIFFSVTFSLTLSYLPKCFSLFFHPFLSFHLDIIFFPLSNLLLTFKPGFSSHYFSLDIIFFSYLLHTTLCSFLCVAESYYPRVLSPVSLVYLCSLRVSCLYIISFSYLGVIIFLCTL